MFCTHCGAEINDDAFVCVKCGCRVDQKLPAAQANAQRDDTMVTVIKVFLILGCIAEGWLLIPLAWCIPMTVKIFNCLKTGTPISTGMHAAVCQSGRRDLPALHGRQQVAAAASNQKNE